LNTNIGKRDTIVEIKIDNVSCINPRDIADHFNIFTNIGSSTLT